MQEVFVWPATNDIKNYNNSNGNKILYGIRVDFFSETSACVGVPSRYNFHDEFSA